MTAAADSPRAPSRLATALRTVIAAGGWANGLLLLGLVAGPLLASLADADRKAFTLGLAFATICTLFWSMLAGSRLVALFLTCSRLRLPGWDRQALLHAAFAALLAVVAPAAALTAAQSGGFALAATVLAAGAAVGLFWVSMPPWMMWVLLGTAGAAIATATWWTGDITASAAPAWIESPVAFGMLAAATLAASAACWAWLLGLRRMPGQWSTPLALLMAAGTRGTPEQAQQANWNSLLFALDTPVGSTLRREPQQALAIVLGPGFGRPTLKGTLAAQGPILAVAASWLLLRAATDGKLDVALGFAPLLVLSTALAPALRLQTLFWRPALGLHELALLPGLPRRPALALAGQLARQMIGRGLPALAIMSGYGLAVGAPHAYLLTLLWTCAAGLSLLAGAALLSLHSRIARGASAVLGVLVVVAALASTMTAASLGTRTPAWLLPAWSLAMGAGVVLHGVSLARLKALPHPWLQN